jgi:hypothetical protein
MHPPVGMCHHATRPWRGGGSGCQTERHHPEGLCLLRVDTWPALGEALGWVEHRSLCPYVTHHGGEPGQVACRGIDEISPLATYRATCCAAT